MRQPTDQVDIDLFLAINSLRSLSAVLGLPVNKLTFLLYAVPKERRYREFSIEKRNGNQRVIRAPIKPIKDLQRSLADLLSGIYKPRNCVYGYVYGRGIRENADLHKNQRWILKIDLKDFFPSINFGRVRGVFLKPPFNFPPSIATVLAQLTTHENELPQGAPTSPVISNLICRRLDRSLLEMARKYRCFYSRYADDIIISTARKEFPSSLAVAAVSDTTTTTKLGSELSLIVESHGFTVNESKVSLRGRNSRQMCTGLVVNQRPNVSREYVRQLRTMLHLWRRFTLVGAGKTYFERIDKRHRVVPPNPDLFSLVVRGKLQFLGSVKGWNDPVYLALAKKLGELDNTYKPKPVATDKASQITIWAEGDTDYKHLSAALSYFQKQGLYNHIAIDLPQSTNTRGSQQLLTMCRNYAETRQRQPCVFVFDRDEPKIIEDVMISGEQFKYWHNRVYSFAIPIPAHRSGMSEVCIEMYYSDEELTRLDKNGRRLFLRDEFDPEGVHKTNGKLFNRHHKTKTLVLDAEVIDSDQRRNVALPKRDFASYVFRTRPAV